MAKGWGDAWRSWTPPTHGEIRMPLPADFNKPLKAPKYHNIKTVAWDGTLCDSKKECARWEQLRAMFSAGLITDLLPHPSFPLYVNGTRTGRFTCDSLYVENGRLVIEDVKSKITRANTAYRQRLKTFQACYPHIVVREHID